MHRTALRRCLVGTSASLCLIVAACGSDDQAVVVHKASATTTSVSGAPTTSETADAPATEPTESTGDYDDDTLDWRSVDGDDIEEAFLEVPLDYDDPSGESIELYLVRHRAADPANRIGSLLVNPGGPGSGGSFLALQADAIYGDDLLDRFDIIGWDPRGTGESEPAIDCIDDYDPYFGIETGPDTPAQEQELVSAAAAFGEACGERSGELLSHVSTADAARDMDQIREALGEETISYFGWSYGTQLGATWATMFPDTVRAAVLDGAINPKTGRVQGLIDQAAGFDSTLSTYLAACSADATCAFNNGGDAEGAFSALLAQFEEEPLATVAGRPDLDDGVFEIGVAYALYSESSWPQLSDALAAAQAGDGSLILELYDGYYGRAEDGTFGNDGEAYFVISCVDDPPVGGVDAAIAERDEFEAVSRIGYTQAYELVICASLPPFTSEHVEITGAGAGPIMVVGNTGDPATPFEGSKVMAESLEKGFFVTVEADSHTAYGLNECIDDTIEAYLVDGDIPAPNIVC